MRESFLEFISLALPLALLGVFAWANFGVKFL